MDGPVERQRAAAADQFAERLAVDVLGDEVGPARIEAEIEEADDLRVLHARQGDRFDAHLPHRGGAVENVLPVDDLEGDELALHLVVAAEDEAGRPAAEELRERVGTDQVAHLRRIDGRRIAVAVRPREVLGDLALEVADGLRVFAAGADRVPGARRRDHSRSRGDGFHRTRFLPGTEFRAQEA